MEQDRVGRARVEVQPDGVCGITSCVIISFSAFLGIIDVLCSPNVEVARSTDRTTLVPHGTIIETLFSEVQDKFMTTRSYAVILSGFFTVSIAYSIRYGYGLLLPEMLKSLQISKVQAGAIFSSYFVVYTLATPILGALTDRFNYRLILTLFTIVLSGGAALMAFADSLGSACFYFAIAGLGHAACWAPVTALVQKWVPNQKRGTALAVVTMGIGLGLPMWSILLPRIVQTAGWEKGWIALGIFGIGVAMLNYALVRNPENQQTKNKEIPPSAFFFWKSYGFLIEKKLFWIIGVGYLFVGVTVIIPFAFLPMYARDAMELPYSSSTRFVAIIALSGVVGQLILGPLSDNIGRLRVMMTCGFLMGIACMGIALTQIPLVVYLASGCFGLGYGAVWSAYGAAASDFFPATHTGGIVGLWTCFYGVGSVFAPILCGWTIDASGNYTWTFIIGLCSGLLSAMVLLKAPSQNH